MLRDFDACMAVLAVNLEFADVQLVGKRHRLLGTLTNVGYIIAHTEIEH
jgi:hypothetical protein